MNSKMLPTFEQEIPDVIDQCDAAVDVGGIYDHLKYLLCRSRNYISFFISGPYPCIFI